MDELASIKIAIARDLHDGIAQEVTALGYKVDEIIGRRDTPQQARSDLRELRLRITTISGLIRDEIFSLRGIDQRPLPEVVLSIGEMIFEDRPIELQVSLGEHIPQGIRPALIKIIQESLFNIKMHSSATTVEISQGANSVTIKDNGGGRYTANADRWGTAGMQERALTFGGTVDFMNDQSGAMVVISWNAEQ